MIRKQPVTINFSEGLNTKTDPWQVPIGQFLSLVNSVFTRGGQLKKRNGFAELPTLPTLPTQGSYLTTLNGNLTSIGSTVNALNTGNNTWIQKGSIAPAQVSTLPLIRNSINQTQCDSSIATNGLICTVYTETNSGANAYKYVIADSVTGQNIVAPTLIPAGAGVVTGSPRVFLLGNYFVIVFTNVISATSHLQYIAISTANTEVVTAAQDIAAAYVSATTLSWDGVVANSNLYISYNTTSGGQSIKITFLTASAASQGQTPATAVTFASQIATMMSMCVDRTNASVPVIYLSFYDSAGSTGKMIAIDLNMNTLMSVTSVITSGSVLNLASASQNGVCTLYYEVANNYSYDSGIPSHYVASRKVTLPATVTTGTVSPAAGSASSGTVIVRSVGLASKAFIINNVQYFLAVYSNVFQATYFLINGSQSLASSPVVTAKLAYENAGGYLTLGLPKVSASGSAAKFPYLYKDLIAAENTASATPVSGQILGVYSQTGINLATIELGSGIDAAEIAGSLHVSGGFLWMYDGYLPVEHNFFLYPDNVEITTATSGGHLADQDYFYVATYEWEDNQGNVYRSATSIPVKQTTTGGGNSTNTVNVPYLRLTYKIANPAKIVIYRWSTAQPIYYRITQLTVVQTNSTTSDSLAFSDTNADSSIVGNDILYTTGGVVEDINAPASNIITLFDTRLWLVDAEDKNLLWYSKQVIESTPVEMSDLLTFYVPPTTAAQGSTGPITALAPMDDKLIIFKENAIYYINGTGPDNTGANNQYSQPIFITSTVGCANQQSIVFMPQGLMFQSGNGIWLLGRDLSTMYAGAPVEKFNGTVVKSAVNVPNTTQVRFALDTGQMLMYDYYYSSPQEGRFTWGIFEGAPAISSCIYQNMQTLINSNGNAFQESIGAYLDGSVPVEMSFTTGWLNLAGLQGYQRAFFFYILGQYYSPHKCFFQIAYDYDSSLSSSVMITPTNFSPAYGGDGADEETPYGQQTKFGGSSNVENWRIFLKRQRCQSFQITFSEIYDPSLGVPAGAGLTLSGLNLIVGVKQGFRPIGAAHSAGTK